MLTANALASEIVFAMQRPYFDLTPVSNASMQAQVPLKAWNVFETGHGPRLQRSMTSSLRNALSREAPHHFIALRDPRETFEQARTQRWSRLCEIVDELEARPITCGDINALHLIISLGFHRLAVDLTRRCTISSESNSNEVDTYLVGAIARYHVQGLFQQ